jgi:hypothetical protein
MFQRMRRLLVEAAAPSGGQGRQVAQVAFSSGFRQVSLSVESRLGSVADLSASHRVGPLGASTGHDLLREPDDRSCKGSTRRLMPGG